jgi:hypothetical protein
LKTAIAKKRTGRVAQGVGPEFKPRTAKNKQKQKQFCFFLFFMDTFLFLSLG